MWFLLRIQLKGVLFLPSPCILFFKCHLLIIQHVWKVLTYIRCHHHVTSIRILDCYDVSKYCRGSGPNCNNSIYQRRCRKSCNLCSKPLPTECQGKRDSSSSNCVSLISSGQCQRNNVKMQCEQSCCLRNYR